MRRSGNARVRHGFAALGGLALFGHVAVAGAQETASASDVALARTLGGEGVQLAEEGNCAAAVEKLQRAETLYHAPTILVRLGECQVALGRVVLGTENLQRVVRESLPPRAPKPFLDAQVRAQKSLELALPKLAKLRIHVDAPAGAKLAVTVDGEPVSLAALDLDRPADPGVHRVEVSAPGYRTGVAEQSLREGESANVSIAVQPDSASSPSPLPIGDANALRDAGASSTAPATHSTGSSRVPGYLLLAAGGLGVAIGSVMGVVALSKKSGLDEQCPDGRAYCGRSAQSDIDAMNGAATGATIGFVAGGLAAGAGALFLVLTTPKAHDTATRPATRAAQLTPFVTVGSAGVWGTF